jgi:hypothetical protein
VEKVNLHTWEYKTVRKGALNSIKTLNIVSKECQVQENVRRYYIVVLNLRRHIIKEGVSSTRKCT